MFGDVEPFGEVVGARVGVHRGQPLVLLFLQFRESGFTRSLQQIQIIVEVVPFDGLARRLAEVHRDIPFLFHVVGHFLPTETAKHVGVIKGVCCSEVIEQRADRVRFSVDQPI